MMHGEMRPYLARGACYKVPQRPRHPHVTGRLESLATLAHRNRGEEIYGSDCSNDYWYRVLSGAARCYIVLPGGRRQILDLPFPGDFFGFTGRERHFYAVDAVVDDTSVACYPREALQALADSDPAVAHEIREMLFGETARLQQLILILGRTTAREKVGAFLLTIMQRIANENTDRLVLPTSRYDIADYLAMSVETVSRSLSDLKHRGLISLTGPRRVQIVDRHGLQGAAQEWGSDGDRHRRRGIVRGPEFLSIGGTEGAVVDRATNLRQEIDATP
jgi:CRP/FNR family transcriptional regulator, nitrogen fixation regulation protein